MSDLLLFGLRYFASVRVEQFQLNLHNLRIYIYVFKCMYIREGTTRHASLGVEFLWEDELHSCQCNIM